MDNLEHDDDAIVARLRDFIDEIANLIGKIKRSIGVDATYTGLRANTDSMRAS
jgi:hypothetical protein